MSTAATTSSPTRAHAAPVPGPLLQHRRSVARWAFASGRPVHRDALAAIVACRPVHVPGPDHVRTSAVWTAEDIGNLLWNDISEWCAHEHVVLPEPPDVSRTLDSYLRYLSAHRLLAKGSDPVAALRRAITEFGGQRRTARTINHPSRGVPLAPVVPIG